MIKKFSGTYEYFIARTAYLDQVVQQALCGGVSQIVFLGAGYDTRPYRFNSIIKGTRIFELDAGPTQQRKRRLLAQANVPIPPQLVYVSINFEKEAFADVLSNAGFDRNGKTLFVWEGVTYYLSPDAVEDTLGFIRDNSPSGSTLCFDYMIQAPDLASRYGVSAVLEAWRKTYSSEHVQFGIEEGKIESFLSQRGFRLLENLAPDEIEKRFLALRDGSLAGRVVALFNLARASVSG
jgi:methyltransferase (TIGR00027 family)